ncbi:MAG: hypothetical protein ACR2P2_18985 [Nakamurella sp.]
MTRSEDEDLGSAEFSSDLRDWEEIQDFGELDGVDEPDPVAPVGASNELLVRPPPSRISRRDRRAWMEIEGDRIARVRDRQREEGLGFSDGFAHRPPRVLGRSGRRAFRSADRVNRVQWWGRRRARDADTRAVGVLILTLLLVGYIAFRLIWGGDDAPAPSGASAVSTSPSVPAAAVFPSTGNATASSGELSRTSPSSAPTSVPATSAAPATSPATAGNAGPASSVFGNGGNTSRSPAPVPGSSLLPVGVATVIAAPAGATGVPAPSGPVLTADRKTAPATGLAWFRRTCSSSWQQPFGAALTANRAAMTRQGWAYADPARDAQGRQWWTGVVKARQTRRCSHLSVEKFTGPAPSGPATTVMVFQADRTVTSDRPGTTATTVEKVNELRTMSRGDDGLWSVGPVKMAG